MNPTEFLQVIGSEINWPLAKGSKQLATINNKTQNLSTYNLIEKNAGRPW